MVQQPGTSRRSVAFAAVFLVFAFAAFSAAFYLFDGAGYLAPVFDQAIGLMAFKNPSQPSSPAKVSTEPDKLQLPAGMTEEFALRLWQEQIDSQPMIERLINGEVASLKIEKVEKRGDEARLRCLVKMSDGTTTPGVIGFRRLGDNWYVAYASRERQRATGGGADGGGAGDGAPPSGPLPDLDDVDVELLSTMVREQIKSQSVIDEYLAGIVKEVFIEEVVPGPQTVTMTIEMDETHGDGYARLIAIKSDEADAREWFLARFIKTGDETKTAQ